MHMRRWNFKKVSLIFSACFVLYIIFSSGYHKYHIENVINNARPEEVWEYVADFNKMRLLNPTIIDFKILSDSGNAHDWRYTVMYTERLSHWPHWVNTAKADYIVTKSMPDVQPVVYAIESQHQTCFFRGAYCLYATSDFKFMPHSKDTYAVERIKYQCPPFLSSACRRELEFQRKAVMHNLTTAFGKKQYKD